MRPGGLRRRVTGAWWRLCRWVDPLSMHERGMARVGGGQYVRQHYSFAEHVAYRRNTRRLKQGRELLYPIPANGKDT